MTLVMTCWSSDVIRCHGIWASFIQILALCHQNSIMAFVFVYRNRLHHLIGRLLICILGLQLNLLRSDKIWWANHAHWLITLFKQRYFITSWPHCSYTGVTFNLWPNDAIWFPREQWRHMVSWILVIIYSDNGRVSAGLSDWNVHIRGLCFKKQKSLLSGSIVYAPGL